MRKKVIGLMDERVEALPQQVLARLPRARPRKTASVIALFFVQVAQDSTECLLRLRSPHSPVSDCSLMLHLLQALRHRSQEPFGHLARALQAS